MFYSDAMITISLDLADNVELYVFAGTERRNATEAIEKASTYVSSSLPQGAPVKVSVNDQAIVVMKVKSNAPATQTGTGTFSYWVEGRQYNWIDKPFIDVGVGWYYITIIIIFISFCCVCWPCFIPIFLCLGISLLVT